MDVNLYTPEIFRNPFPELERIREAGPAVWNPLAKGWMITGDRNIRRILQNPRQFSMIGSPVQRLFGPEAFIAIDERSRHDGLRAVWSVAFQRDRLDPLTVLVEGIVADALDQIVERLADGEVVDAAAAFCRDLPAYVIASMLGVPASARPDIVRWSDLMGAAVISPPKPGAKGTMSPWELGEQAKQELGEFLIAQMADRRRHPGDDLISQLVHSEIAKTMSDEAIMMNCRQLLFAGNETTAKWLAHILVVLGNHPDARRHVVADGTLMRQVAEEVMRWEPVVHRAHRVVSGADAEVDGVPIAEGETVILFFGAANRDPARYAEPAKFDVFREQKSNLGFGTGIHSCLGVSLARFEVDIAVRRFLERLPNYRIAGAIDYNGLGLRGPSTIPIALEH